MERDGQRRRFCLNLFVPSDTREWSRNLIQSQGSHMAYHAGEVFLPSSWSAPSAPGSELCPCKMPSILRWMKHWAHSCEFKKEKKSKTASQPPNSPHLNYLRCRISPSGGPRGLAPQLSRTTLQFHWVVRYISADIAASKKNGKAF